MVKGNLIGRNDSLSHITDDKFKKYFISLLLWIAYPHHPLVVPYGLNIPGVPTGSIIELENPILGLESKVKINGQITEIPARVFIQVNQNESIDKFVKESSSSEAVVKAMNLVTPKRNANELETRVLGN